MRNVNWAGEGESKIVRAKWRTSDGVEVVEEVIRVQRVVAEEFISASVELAGAAAGDHGDMTAGAAPVLGQVVSALHAELLDGINAGVGEKSEVGAAIDIIRAVQSPVILGRTVAVDREIDLIGEAGGTGYTYEQLIRRQIGGYTGLH